MTITAPYPTFAGPVTFPEPPVRRQRVPARPQLPESGGALVRRAVAGDDRAFATIVRRNAELLRGVATRILRGSSEADDVVQETFIAAWRHLDGVTDGDAITAWLVTTVRRRAFDRLRSAAVQRRADLDESVPASSELAPGDVAERASLVVAAQRVLDGMPAVQRRCWELRHLERHSYDDIAEAMGLPKSTVRGLLARARVVVEQALAPWR
ncbi:RNA polymerase sigma factor [Microbacterium sp. M1A1_1b]